MSSYIEISFDGEYDELLQFMDEKGWEFQAKRKDKSVGYFKIPQELKEEIEFFKGFDLESTNTRIIDISEITDDEFDNIEEYREQSFKPKFVPAEDPEILESERDDLKKKEEESTPFWTTGESKEDDVKLDHSEITAKMPVKSAVKENDPMHYLTNPAFMKKFLIISSAVLLLLSIFN